ncbi:tryptophan synthase subunit alpha [Pseudogemmobacter sonorensis]|uniref:tryptophan synthase subunit alpha n=1 Tax=Pseudogemmobacter sonorensis TaxID=2989681 RepID=UPI003687E3BF
MKQTAPDTPFLARPLRAPILSCYFPLGDPAVPVALLDVYADAGVDVIEIGLASANPALDGAEVRASMARADRGRARADLDLVLTRLALHATPPAALLMSYDDPDHPGRRDPAFWAGLQSALVVATAQSRSLPEIEATAQRAGLPLSAFVPLPVSPAGRKAAQAAGYYVMLQAVEGVTGTRSGIDPGNAARIADLRASGVTAPILPGFGIGTGDQAREMRAMGADGVVVGSAVLRAALDGPKVLARVLTELRSGLDG